MSQLDSNDSSPISLSSPQPFLCLFSSSLFVYPTLLTLSPYIDSDMQSALLADSREAVSQILQESTTFHSSSFSSFSLSLSKSNSNLEQSFTAITDHFDSPDALKIDDFLALIHSLSHESAELLIHFLELFFHRSIPT